MHLRIGLRGGRTSHRACRNRTFRSQSELAGKQFVRAALVHDQHDEIGLRASYLETDTTAFDTHGCRSGPSRRALIAAGEVALAVLASEDKGGGLQSRHNHDA